MNRILVLLLLVSQSVGQLAQAIQPTTQEAAEALRVREGYLVKLVACEPLISDPISARLDAQGRLWVVEMPDYPTGPLQGAAPSGRIKILEDRDSDGTFDHATLFADHLLFATCLQPYRDGAIVTLAGQIVFMRDTDHDGAADETEVWFKGFAEQNQQLRANHPTLGPDGFVYVATGLRGGQVEAVDSRFDPKSAPVDVRDRDFYFDPEGGSWGAVAGKSQFGLTIDDFGRRIGCSNRNPAMMTPMSLEAVDRDPLLAARDAVHDVALAAEQSAVFSRAEAWTTSNLHAGQFSAACGVLAAGLEDASGEWLLACEPTAYLVQRQRIAREGSVWVSRREATADEFLSSTDTWFRPVDAALGMGQSVLIIDMARAVIEHPDFMPPELKSRPDQWDGRELGRIWQITPAGEEISRGQPVLLHNANSETVRLDQAYQWLLSPSPWQREVASQVLLETQHASHDRLRAIVRSQDSPRGRARAAFVMRRHGWLQIEDAEILAQSSDPKLRALAVDLSREFKGGLELAVSLVSDSDPMVLRAVAASLSNADDQPTSRVAGMIHVASQTDDVWTIQILGAVESKLTLKLAQGLVDAQTPRSNLLNHLIQRIAIDDPQAAAKIISRKLEPALADAECSSETLESMEAWIDGTKRGRHSPTQILKQLDPSDMRTLSRICGTIGNAVYDATRPASLRARAVTIADQSGHLPTDLKRLLEEDSPPELRAAVLPMVLKSDSTWTRDYLANHLMGMSVTLRSAAVQACSRSAGDTQWLLSAIADGSIPRTVVDPATANRFRQHSDPDIRKLANELLQSDPNRVKVLERYADAAKQLGDPIQGKKLFLEHCSACHQIDGQGTNVGPDISDTRTKTADALLASILDPNAAIDSAYVQYSVLTVDGRILDGLLVDETSDSVTLQQKGGERITVPRQDIDALQAPGVSLMPQGFEQTMDVPAMSHLLSYLKNWRYLKTSIPGTLPAE